jgi:capsular exopolysaccharide synthesis family protein
MSRGGTRKQEVTEVSEQLQQTEGPEGRDGTSGPPYLELWRIARRRKSLILLGALAGLVLGAIYYATTPPVYESRAQLLVIRKSPQDIPALDPGRGNSEDYLSTQAGILRSPLVIGRAIQDHDLGSLPGVGGTADLANAIALQFKANRDPRDLHNSILELSYRCGDKESSSAVVSGVIDAYQKFLDQTYHNFSKETVGLITRARDELGTDLIKKEEAYRDLRRKTPVLLLKGQNGSTFNGDQLLLIHAKQMEREIRREEIEHRLKEIDQAVKDGRSREELTAMVSQAMIRPAAEGMAVDSTGQLVNAALQERLLPSLLEEKMLLQDYGPNHPQVQAARNKIELARTFVLETLKQELNAVKTSEAVLAKKFEEHTQEARKSVDFDLDEEGARSQVARVEQLYDLTIKRLQEVDMLKDIGGFDAQEIAPPVSRKVGPRAATVFPLALLLGTLIGCGGAYLAEVSDKTFRNAEEVRRRLALPVVGHIPRIQLKREALEVIAASGSNLDPVLVAYHRPKSREAEAFRVVRTALYFGTRGSGRRVIQVTSPSVGDGKSTLAANLAVSIAQSGKRVLLIDADLRKSRIHKIFNVAARGGLSALIAGDCELAQAVHDSGVPGLSIMPCGPVPVNPAELLTSPRFEEALGAAGAQYDFVLIDTPPLLAVTDPCVVAPRVDAVLLTIRITKNGRPQAERSKDILQSLGASIFGVVVNGIVPGGGYGYGYGDSYYSRDAGDNGRGDHYYENQDNGEAQGSAPGTALAGGDGARDRTAPHPSEGNGNS